MANRKQRLEPSPAKGGRHTMRVELRPGVRIDLYANAALRWLCRGRGPDAPRILGVTR